MHCQPFEIANRMESVQCPIARLSLSVISISYIPFFIISFPIPPCQEEEEVGRVILDSSSTAWVEADKLSYAGWAQRKLSLIVFAMQRLAALQHFYHFYFL